MSPPTPDSMRRAVPEGGVRVAGNDVPQGTTVGVSCYAAFRFEQKSSTPNAFKPERWLGLEDNATSPHAKDKRGVFDPFSVGPRHCPGQLLAWVEMRVILARLLWNFNIEILKRLYPSGVEIAKDLLGLDQNTHVCASAQAIIKDGNVKRFSW